MILCCQSVLFFALLSRSSVSPFSHKLIFQLWLPTFSSFRYGTNTLCLSPLCRLCVWPCTYFLHLSVDFLSSQDVCGILAVSFLHVCRAHCPIKKKQICASYCQNVLEFFPKLSSSFFSLHVFLVCTCCFSKRSPDISSQPLPELLTVAHLA